MEFENYVNQIIDDRYRILKLLGEGGMGYVFLGENIHIKRKVAIKMLHSEWLCDDITIKRFFREAKLAAALKHANIINVLDVGESRNSEPYMVLEYLEGETLSALLKRSGPLDLKTTLDIISPVLNALSVAHQSGIVHRDLKPDNIFLSCPEKGDAVIKLIDFGISKYLNRKDQTVLTVDGTLLGTPMYMSPEQIHNDSDLDHRTDLYAIGVILYRMLTAKLPFDAPNHPRLIMSILNDTPRPPQEAFADFPVIMEPVILTLLNKQAEKRYANAGILLKALTHIREHLYARQSAAISRDRISRTSVVAGDLGIITGSFHSQQTGATVLERHPVNPRIR